MVMVVVLLCSAGLIATRQRDHSQALGHSQQESDTPAKYFFRQGTPFGVDGGDSGLPGTDMPAKQA